MKKRCIWCGNVYENDGKPPHKTVEEGACELCAKSRARLMMSIGRGRDNWRSSIQTRDTLGR